MRSSDDEAALEVGRLVRKCGREVGRREKEVGKEKVRVRKEKVCAENTKIVSQFFICVGYLGEPVSTPREKNGEQSRGLPLEKEQCRNGRRKAQLTQVSDREGLEHGAVGHLLGDAVGQRAWEPRELGELRPEPLYPSLPSDTSDSGSLRGGDDGPLEEANQSSHHTESRSRSSSRGRHCYLALDPEQAPDFLVGFH